MELKEVTDLLLIFQKKNQLTYCIEAPPDVRVLKHHRADVIFLSLCYQNDSQMSRTSLIWI